MSSSPSQVPVVDFANFNESNLEDRRRIANEITTACRKLGFVYIVNHAMPPELLDEALSWSKKFFDLPQEEKEKAPQSDNPTVLRGYSSQIIHDRNDPSLANNNLREVTDHKERYDMGSDQNTDHPNVWTPEQTLPKFRPFMNKFYWECFHVAGDILKAIALGIGLEDENYFQERHGGNNNRLGLLHYPPVTAETLRIPTQTDWGSITMRFQNVGGMEVENIDSPGTFIPAPPEKNAIMVNVGDLLQRWSNDEVRSASYRVTLPPESDRYSILYLVTPDPDTVIECPPACGGPNNPPKYHPIKQCEYYRLRSKMRRPSKAEVGGGGITNYAPY